MPTRRISISNNAPLLGWLFMIMSMSGLAAITLGVIKSGCPPDGLPAPVGVLLILLIWAFGFAFTVAAFGSPVTRLTIEDGWVTAQEIWPWKRRETRFSPRKNHLRIVRTEDCDGDTSFRLELMAPEGRMITVATSSQEAKVEAKRDWLIAVLGAGAT